MTIAACYVSNEGVVLGADSTSSFLISNGFRHYNNEQKLFEIGEMGSTLGIVTWGLGGLPNVSYRRLLAELSDDLIHAHPVSVQDVADRWNARFWAVYSAQLPGIPPQVRYAALMAMATRTPEQEQEMQRLRSDLSVGFILGG